MGKLFISVGDRKGKLYISALTGWKALHFCSNKKGKFNISVVMGKKKLLY
jgi:hypothetical protein